jgi:hypothetical protein
MNNKHSALCAFLASAVVGGILAYAGEASAVWRRQSAMSCVLDSADSHWVLSEQNAVYTTNHLANQSTSSITLMCPALDDSLLAKTSVTTFNVHGSNLTGNSVSVKVCYSEYDSAGGSCGSATSSSAVNYTLTPNLSAWSSAQHFGYVLVTLPGKVYSAPYGYVVASLAGFYYSN